ncbi:MAG: hypothetical protein ACOCWU_05530 [Spirochaetota bacterium]
MLLIIATLLLASCAGVESRYESSAVVETGGRQKEEAAATLDIMAETRADAADGEARLVSPLLPGTELRGVTQSSGDSTAFYVYSVRLFGNWANGWTEGIYEATGEIRLTGADDRRRASLITPIEIWSIRKGTIRFYDDYIRGEEGVSAVEARVSRLEALAGWYREAGGPVYTVDPKVVAEEALAEALERRPARFEGLLESQTLQHDVEEAPELLGYFYNLPYLEENIVETTQFKETK